MREEILEHFGRLRRRELWVRGRDLFLRAAFVLTLSVAGLQLLFRLAFELGAAAPYLARPGDVIASMAAALAGAALFAAAVLLMKPTSPALIAWRLDRATEGEERFLSAVELAAAAAPGGPFAEALCEDAARKARKAEPKRVVPHVPLGHRWGICLALASTAVLVAFPPTLYGAPVADFEAGALRGTAPLRVVFRDASMGAIGEFTWDFGDGTDARGELVAHVFKEPGRYPVRLTVRGPEGRSEKIREVEVLPAGQVVVDFEAVPDKGRALLEVRFRNLSQGADRFRWDFGDGSTSEEREPVHLFRRPGIHTVRLRGENSFGSDSMERSVTVVREEAPLADFRAQPRKGAPPLLVHFEDLSTGEVTRWAWDFGDLYAGTSGRKSTERNPSHTYRVAGRYSVRLRVTGPYGEDEERKVYYIHVTQQGSGGGGGGGAAAKAGGAGGQTRPGGAGNKPGRVFGERTKRPKITTVPEGVKPHAQGGALKEKIKVFGRPEGGGGEAGEVPYESVFPSYRRVAEDSMSREHIPSAMRDAVRRYFENLRPK
jgi:PKD repeat protein